jgi:hypothetical protein
VNDDTTADLKGVRREEASGEGGYQLGSQLSAEDEQSAFEVKRNSRQTGIG